MELSDEQFIELSNFIDGTLVDIAMKAHEDYGMSPIHTLSVLLGRMGVMAREIGDLDVFSKVVSTASAQLTTDSVIRTLQ